MFQYKELKMRYEAKNKSNVRNAKRKDVENVHLHVNIAKDRIARIVHGSVKNVINLTVNNALKKELNVQYVGIGDAETMESNAQVVTNRSANNASSNVQCVLKSVVLIAGGMKLDVVNVRN
ncbi:MAG: hypothetical protein EZS28_030053 [Streblomastix strix]|uniref:Uncharacterized protein n=1 Tax=Streblomastix strix TaxID=222440 RepID=A0A5J4UWY6_9EUKA|nr:MAG: hypothetical protein EZS28_030053 [Streblomastix strix]